MPEALALDDELKAHADKVYSEIVGLIDQSEGWLRFDAYMQTALYAPGLGYYVAGKRKFGPDGDFITAPELGDLFGACVARQCAEVLAETGGDLLELGAGSGALACSMLTTLQGLDALPERYLILEVSPDLRALQAESIRHLSLDLQDRVEWLEQLPPPGFKGAVVANEVLDAMPVRRFCLETLASGEERVNELGVVLKDGQLALSPRPAGSKLKQTIQSRKQNLNWPSHYCSEINLQAESWVQTLAERVAQGVLLLIDYGFPRHELYHPDRAEGTLMCHFQHQAHGDALHLPGLQDITSHVDFTAIAEAGQAAGLQLAGFSHQAAFLMNLGLLEQAAMGSESAGNIEQQLRLSQEIKKLTLPHEMGELFKVIALSKHLDSPLSGFSRNDQSPRLWTTFKSSF